MSVSDQNAALSASHEARLKAAVASLVKIGQVAAEVPDGFNQTMLALLIERDQATNILDWLPAHIFIAMQQQPRRLPQ